MPKYSFATDEIGVSDECIHLLRSGYNYETIPYAEISRVRICRGREVNNWFHLFTIGLVVLVAGIILREVRAGVTTVPIVTVKSKVYSEQVVGKDSADENYLVTSFKITRQVFDSSVEVFPRVLVAAHFFSALFLIETKPADTGLSSAGFIFVQNIKTTHI